MAPHLDGPASLQPVAEFDAGRRRRRQWHTGGGFFQAVALFAAACVLAQAYHVLPTLSLVSAAVAWCRGRGPDGFGRLPRLGARMALADAVLERAQPALRPLPPKLMVVPSPPESHLHFLVAGPELRPVARPLGEVVLPRPRMPADDPPRWLRWLPGLAAGAVVARRMWRRLFGVFEAVALDPVLPWAVRWQLLQSRRSLRTKGRSAPPALKRLLEESADIFEELPALLVAVSILVGDALRLRRGHAGPTSLHPFRQLGEAQALLFIAGRLHLDDGRDTAALRLLGGDFLFAEGQWSMAELGSLPAIRRTAQLIRDVSDGATDVGAAMNSERDVAALGAKMAWRAAYLNAGANFATVAEGAGWLSGAPLATVKALSLYGADLGCAMHLARCRDDVLAQDLALWLVHATHESLDAVAADVGASAAIRSMRSLATRVERSCTDALESLPSGSRTARGLSYGEFCELRRDMMQVLLAGVGSSREGDDEGRARGPGFQRDAVAEKELDALIAAGLQGQTLEVPPADGSDGAALRAAALDGGLRLIQHDLLEVNRLLDGAVLAAPAVAAVVRDEVEELFRTPGKRLRPALALLVARALGVPPAKRSRVTALAASIEVLHCASLVHDDILDGAEVRRGVAASHARLGERAAGLVGDYLFATASCMVADLGSIPVVLLISKVVADFGRGELAQSALHFRGADNSLEAYLAKSFYKTASLLAAACQAAAILSGAAPESEESIACYRFGAYIGLAFQVVDDILDYTSSEETLGKPALADLREGNFGAPVLLSVHRSPGENAEQVPDATQRMRLVGAIERRFSEDGDLECVMDFVAKAEGVERSRALARRFAALAVAELAALPAGEAREALHGLADFVVARTH